MNIDPLRQIYRKNANKDKPPALLGNGNGLVVYPNLPNTVWIMLPTSVGYLQATALLPSSVVMTLTPNSPIRLGYDEKGRRVVLGGDGDAIAAQGGSTVGQLQAVLSPSAPQTNFQTLNLVAKTGLLVSLRGWNVIAAGVYTEAQYPDIDLSSHVPAAVGGVPQMRYVGIFVKADFTDVDLVDSTPRGTSDLPLGAADVNEILAAATLGDTAAWCVKLVTGQTQVTQSGIQTDAQDLRQTVNVTSGISPAQDSVRFTGGASANVTNTVTETTLVASPEGSQTLSANALSTVGRQLRIEAWGYIGDILTPTLELKFKLGSTAILDTGAITLITLTGNQLWHFVGTATIQTAGSSGKIIGQGQFTYNQLITDILNTSQTTLDTTASLAADLTAQFGTANAANTIVCTNVVLEVLN